MTGRPAGWNVSFLDITIYCANDLSQPFPPCFLLPLTKLSAAAHEYINTSIAPVPLAELGGNPGYGPHDAVRQLSGVRRQHRGGQYKLFRVCADIMSSQLENFVSFHVPRCKMEKKKRQTDVPAA